MASSIDQSAALADVRSRLLWETDRADRATAEAKYYLETSDKWFKEADKLKDVIAELGRSIRYEKEVGDRLGQDYAYRERDREREMKQE
ncbi:MAG: hypothetical protein Hyperionvirus35_19, partial [Hyperionvirus sp.]